MKTAPLLWKIDDDELMATEICPRRACKSRRVLIRKIAEYRGVGTPGHVNIHLCRHILIYPGKVGYFELPVRDGAE